MFNEYTQQVRVLEQSLLQEYQNDYIEEKNLERVAREHRQRISKENDPAAQSREEALIKDLLSKNSAAIRQTQQEFMQVYKDIQGALNKVLKLQKQFDDAMNIAAKRIASNAVGTVFIGGVQSLKKALKLIEEENELLNEMGAIEHRLEGIGQKKQRLIKFNEVNDMRTLEQKANNF